MNTYKAVCSDAGIWTVEWASCGVTLGDVRGYYVDEEEAQRFAYELTSREMRAVLKLMHAIYTPRPLPPAPPAPAA